MNKIVSPYRRGADAGFFLGIWLCAMFFALIYSRAVPLLGVLSVLLFAGVPVLLYRQLRRTYVEEMGMTTLSGLWMQGIVTFACGSLISALAAYVFLRWIQPEYILGCVREAIDFYAAIDDPQAVQVADLLTRMVEANLVPTAASIALETVWIAIFTGSLLSLLLSLIARAVKLPHNKLNS
ncbi:MAG: DUF4199 domain-containing protein [Muribaculaceae bacterium]|nr:DUF4199 domain-containing protein [Muribaculaceae bacterium]